MSAVTPVAVIGAGLMGGRPGSKLSGTIQNEVLKECIARGTYISPPTSRRPRLSRRTPPGTREVR